MFVQQQSSKPFLIILPPIAINVTSKIEKAKLYPSPKLRKLTFRHVMFLPYTRVLGQKVWISWQIMFLHDNVVWYKPHNICIFIIITCPLLLGGGGPTCRFIAIIWGGGPPQYTMFWKSGPPQCTIIWKKGAHTNMKVRKKTLNSL